MKFFKKEKHKLRRYTRKGICLVLALCLAGGLDSVMALSVQAEENQKQTGTTYYVDPDAGKDSNTGTSEAEPFQTLAHVSGLTLEPGDSVLLKRGSVFPMNDTLTPQGSGTKEAPITIGAYGDENADRPIIQADKQYSGTSSDLDFRAEKASPIGIFGYSHYVIQDVHVKSEKTMGIHIELDLGTEEGRSAVMEDFTIRNVTASDCKWRGYPDAYPNAGGIRIGRLKGDQVYTPGYIKDVLIEDCYIRDCDDGISSKGNHIDDPRYPRNENIVVRNCFLEGISGNGITAWGTDNSLFERSRYLNGHGTRYGSVAMWGSQAKNLTIQYNEISECMDSTVDGDAFDLDWGSEGHLIQYNYAHDNYGGLILEMAWAQGGANGPTRNNTVRYNVARNNGTDTIQLASLASQGQENNYYINNTIVTAPRAKSVVFSQMGVAAMHYFYNNIFVITAANTRPVVDSTGNGLMDFDNNCWYAPQGHGVIRWNGADYNTLKEWSEATGSEANGLFTDPMLISTEGLGRMGLQLAEGSPCIDAGRDVPGKLGTRDYYGNALTHNGIYDIGAYEGGGLPVQQNDTNLPVPNYLASSSWVNEDQTEFWVPENLYIEGSRNGWKPMSTDSEPKVTIDYGENVSLNRVVVKGTNIKSIKLQTAPAGSWSNPSGVYKDVYDDGTWTDIATVADFTGEYELSDTVEATRIRVVVEPEAGMTPELTVFKGYNTSGETSDLNLLHHWDFEEGTGADGTLIEDKAGAAEGTLKTSETEDGNLWADGKDGGKALKLDEAKETHVLLSGAQDISDDWTFMATLRRDTTGTNPTPATLMGSTPDSKQGQYHNLMLTGYDTATKANTNRIGFSNFTKYDVTTQYATPEGQWVDMAIVRQGTEVTLYIGGVKTETVTTYDTNKVPKAFNLGMGAIGYRGHTDAGKAGKYMTGAIDDIKIYEGALTEAQIKEIYGIADTEPKVSYSGVNGKVTVTYDSAPAAAPVQEDFALTASVNGGEAQDVVITGFEYDEARKQATLTYAPFERTDVKQEVIVTVDRKGETADLPAFMLPAKQYADINITTAAADNGSLTVSFDKKPAMIPQLTDFTITATKNGEPCELANLQMGTFDSQTNGVTFSFDKLYAEDVDQAVEISVIYRGKEAKASFTIDKMNTAYYLWDFEGCGTDGSTDIPEQSNRAPGTLVTTSEAAGLWIPGYDGSGTALNFDGATYVNLPDGGDLAGEWTFSAWIKRTDAQGEGQLGQSTLMGSTTASSSNGSRYGLMLEGYSSDGKLLTDNVGISKDGALDQVTDYQAPVDEWVYLSIVRRDSEMIVYENGVKVAVLTLKSGNDVLGMGAIGALQRGNGFVKYMKGAMDEIAVYEAALSPEKINELYLQYTGEEPEPPIDPGKPADKAVLNEELRKAKAINTALYTKESVSALQTAVNNGEAVLNNPAVTQQEVNNAVQQLQEAVRALVRLDAPGGGEVNKTPSTGDDLPLVEIVFLLCACISLITILQVRNKILKEK